MLSLLVKGLLFLPAVCSAYLTNDWLISDAFPKTTLQVQALNHTITLTNGIISKTFQFKPNGYFVLTDFYSFEKDTNMLRTLHPEAVITLDYIKYNIGGALSNMNSLFFNKTSLKYLETDPHAFRFVRYTQSTPEAPYPYTPMRGAPKDIVWPPRGLRLDVTFQAPASAPDAHRGVVVTVHHEMYDGIPLVNKWITVQSKYSDVVLSVQAVEVLGVTKDWSPQDESWMPSMGPQNYLGPFDQGWMYVETDMAHSTQTVWSPDPAQAKTPGSFLPMVTCNYQLNLHITLKQTFVSFKVHELVIASSDVDRHALAKHRMVRLLAPQTQERPLFFHMIDSTNETAVYAALDQMAEVKFDMMIFSFGSHFDIETRNETLIQRMKAYASYAKTQGIEIGGYDIISLTRYYNVPSEYLAIDPDTQESSGNACMASDWFTYLLERFLSFISETGISMVETDGPYGGETHGFECASDNHTFHQGVGDSIYWNTVKQGEFFIELRKRNIYINQPDIYFYQGGNRDGMGYNENQYSLPRWEDISISRQSLYDDLYRLIPTQGWMFVPLVPYHGGGDAAAFEPLHDNLMDYEWALAQYMGAGVAACYRGFRLYDTNETKAVVEKWTSFYRKYQDILASDIVHVRRADLQDIDGFMHVNYKLDIKALVMVFNPTDMHIKRQLALPMYYTGLNRTAVINEQDVKHAAEVRIDAHFTSYIDVDLDAKSITWFTIRKP